MGKVATIGRAVFAKELAKEALRVSTRRVTQHVGEAVLDAATPEGVVEITTEELVGRTGWKTAAVRKALKDLQSLGVIVRDRSTAWVTWRYKWDPERVNEVLASGQDLKTGISATDGITPSVLEEYRGIWCDYARRGLAFRAKSEGRITSAKNIRAPGEAELRWLIAYGKEIAAHDSFASPELAAGHYIEGFFAKDPAIAKGLTPSVKVLERSGEADQWVRDKIGEAKKRARHEQRKKAANAPSEPPPASGFGPARDIARQLGNVDPFAAFDRMTARRPGGAK